MSGKAGMNINEKRINRVNPVNPFLCQMGPGLQAANEQVREQAQYQYKGNSQDQCSFEAA